MQHNRTCSECKSYKYPRCLIRNAKTPPTLIADNCFFFELSDLLQQ